MPAHVHTSSRNTFEKKSCNSRHLYMLYIVQDTAWVGGDRAIGRKLGKGSAGGLGGALWRAVPCRLANGLFEHTHTPPHAIVWLRYLAYLCRHRCNHRWCVNVHMSTPMVIDMSVHVSVHITAPIPAPMAAHIAGLRSAHICTHRCTHACMSLQTPD